MSKPWQAEKIVSAELATHLINEQFPEITINQVTKLGEGWDNTVYLINKTWVFRFPRRNIAVQLLENETKVLNWIEGNVPLTIPKPMFQGRATKLFAWTFCGYQLIPGKTLDRAVLTTTQRIDNIERLAGFLKSLHQIEITEFQKTWEVTDELERLDISSRVPQALSRIETLLKQYQFAQIEKLKAYLKSLSPLHQVEYSPCLVHGDLYAKHLICDEQQRLSGIIDWGDTHIGNPAVDLSIVFAFIPNEAQAEFFKIYPKPSDAICNLALFRAIYSTVTIFVYALDIGDALLAKEAEYALKNILLSEFLEF